MASEYDLNNDGLIDYMEVSAFSNKYQGGNPYLAFESLWDQGYEFDQMANVWSNYYKAYNDKELMGSMYPDDIMLEYFNRQGLDGEYFLNHYKHVLQNGTGYERYNIMENLNKDLLATVRRDLHPLDSGSNMFETLGSGIGDVLEGAKDIAVGAVTLDTDQIKEGFDTTLSGAGDVITGGLEIGALPVTIAAGTVKVGLEYAGDVISDLFAVDMGGGSGVAEVAPDVSLAPYFGGKDNKIGRRETIYSAPDKNWSDDVNSAVADSFIYTPSAYQGTSTRQISDRAKMIAGFGGKSSTDLDYIQSLLDFGNK